MMFASNRRRGAAGSQYALIVGLIGIVALLAVTMVGRNIGSLFTNVSNRLTNTAGGGDGGGTGGAGTGGGSGPPTITLVTPGPLALAAGSTATNALHVQVADPDTALASLTVTVTSNDPAAIDTPMITASGTGADRRFSFTIPSSARGTPTLTVTVSDGASSASLTVAAVVMGRSCKALRDAGVTVTGLYTIDPDGAGALTAFDVWCDMTTHGGGWTLLESYSYGNVATYRYRPFSQDFGRNATTPGNTTDFRLSRARMQQIDTNATEWRTTCNFASNTSLDYMIGPLNLSDHAGGSSTGLDVLDYNGSGGTFSVSQGNIRSNSVSGSIAFWQGDSTAYHLCIDSQLNGVPGSVASEDNFGFYGVVNSNFSCTASSSSTTQWWLR